MRKRVRLITRGYRGEGPRTSVSHTLVLDDNCMDALSQTLKLMIRNWERKLINNENAPLRKWLYCAREVEDRLFYNAQLMSWHTYGNDA